jgi:cytochrome c oxidase assembly factor CtaG
MICAVHATHESWSMHIPVTFTLALATIIYLRGWVRLRRLSPELIPVWRLAAFMSGLLALWIPVGSPLEMLDHVLLTVHMVQHILLMAVAPPLILLGAPALTLRWGLPQHLVRNALGPMFRWPPLQRLGRILTHPVFGWLTTAVALIGWHLPSVFQLGQHSESWHAVQHASFLITGLLFWWPVVQPWPSVARWPRWCIPLYLFFATLPCDVLSAFLAFCGRVVYSSYLTAPRLFPISALQDQQRAAALMWMCATFLYLIPAVVITIQLLSPPRTLPVNQTRTDLGGIAASPLPAEAEAVQ